MINTSQCVLEDFEVKLSIVFPKTLDVVVSR